MPDDLRQDMRPRLLRGFTYLPLAIFTHCPKARALSFHLLNACLVAAPRGLSVADLTEGRSPSCNGGGGLFSPTAKAVSSRALRFKKARCRHPTLTLRPHAVQADRAPGQLIAIEAAMVAGSKQQGELTWLPSEPLRKSAMNSTVKS